MELLVGPIFTQLLNRIIPLAEEPLARAWNVEKDLKDIRKNLETINYVLEYTDKRALRDPFIQTWISDLRDMKDQMEEVIDDYEYERQQLTPAPFYKEPKIWNLCRRISKRIKVIRKNLELIQKRSDQIDISKFGLNSDEKDKNKHRANTQASPISANIVGHQVERNTYELLKLVTEGDENERKVSIIAITGMGGIGKTTLAQNVYSKIKDMGTIFDIICWVSLTKDTDDVTLLKEMMESIDEEHNKGISSKVKLLENLKKFVKGDNFPRKFFIVLDDIWKADMYNELLSGPLNHGALGSKIIITTRDVNIPKKLQAIHIFSINVLSEKDALSLLYMNVFGNECNEEEKEDKNLLKSIAIGIVMKCAFLPLAIKAVGGVLRTKDRLENEWNRILNSDLWDLPDFDERVMTSLNLSYEDMEWTHKQCFLYLSLFPNKYSLCKKESMSCWVAEGLIEGGKADKCFEMFIQRNLLQRHPTVYNRYVMHDIVHQFVRKLSSEECAFEDGVKLQDSNVRRYSIANNNTSIFPYKDRSADGKSLKSIMIINCKQVAQLPSKGTFEKLRYLRVLMLNDTGTKVIPDYISKLVHLRILDLCYNPIESLPETIGNLVNLQSLLLFECEVLKALPNSLSRLTNLEWLDVSLDWKGYVPKGLDKLTKLECLKKYGDIRELGPLNSLKVLKIEKLDAVEPIIAAKEAKVMDKLNLQRLHFFCTYRPFLKENPKMSYSMEVLEELCPPPCLEILHFHRFYGPRLPSWLSFKCHICLRNVTDLRLFVVTCEQLLHLGELPSLQYLGLYALNCVRSLGLEFFYENGRRRADARPFRKLKALWLHNMRELEECQWVNVDPGPSNINKEGEPIGMPFPQLNELSVIRCRKLKFLWGCLPAAAALKKLVIKDCGGLETIPELPTITVLEVVDCCSIKQAGPFHSLEHVLWEERHGKIKCLPKWLGELSSGDAPSAPSLQSLRMIISDSHMLRRLDRDDIGFDWPFIRNVPHVLVEAKYGIRPGDRFRYTKSPFLMEVIWRGWRRIILDPVFRPRWAWPPVDLVTCHRKPVKLNEHQKEDDATTPRQIVPGTARELMTKLESVFPSDDKSTELLPFGFHAHAEVITAGGPTQILCLDKKSETVFASQYPCHIHVPVATAQGEPAVVCFSDRHDNEDDAITPREIVPGTRLELRAKPKGVLPSYGKGTELPFGFHAHVEVITADGQTQIMCVDQLHSAETGFVTSKFHRHFHLPYTTAQGDSAVACFSVPSTYHTLVRKWPSSNKQSTATAMRP